MKYQLNISHKCAYKDTISERIFLIANWVLVEILMTIREVVKTNDPLRLWNMFYLCVCNLEQPLVVWTWNGHMHGCHIHYKHLTTLLYVIYSQKYWGNKLSKCTPGLTLYVLRVVQKRVQKFPNLPLKPCTIRLWHNMISRIVLIAIPHCFCSIKRIELRYVAKCIERRESTKISLLIVEVIKCVWTYFYDDVCPIFHRSCSVINQLPNHKSHKGT